MTRLLKYIRLIKKKPSIAVRAGRAFVMANVFERKVLRGAEIAVTYRCQGKCDKCSCRSLIDESKPEMTTEQILKVCRKISSAGAILINLTGGEPLLQLSQRHQQFQKALCQDGSLRPMPQQHLYLYPSVFLVDVR